MRAIVTADIHIHRDRLATHKKLLRHITQQAKSNGAAYVFMVGDMWHEKGGVGVEQLSLIYDELRRAKQAGVLWVWVRGNHECGIKSRPHDTLMTLFQDVAFCAIEPQVLPLERACIALLPWYRSEEFKKAARALAAKAKQHDGTRILMAHVGLNEGKASSSNMYVQQNVAIQDLVPKAYDIVLLGDYHHRQYLTDRILYLGCPISHAHGDDLDGGVWILDTDLNLLQPLGLERGLFPQHRTWRIERPTDTMLIGYDKRDHNRIVVESSQVELYRGLYPDAVVQGRGEVAIDTSSRRTKDMTDRSPAAIWDRVCVNKGLSLEVQTLGKEVLHEVAGKEWTRA